VRGRGLGFVGLADKIDYNDVSCDGGSIGWCFTIVGVTQSCILSPLLFNVLLYRCSDSIGFDT